MSEHITSKDFILSIQYWLRLSTFVHGPLTIALLDVLHNKHEDASYNGCPEDPDDLYNYLYTKYHQTIASLNKKGLVTLKQLQLIFPANKKTDSKQFDVTLIVVLITNCTTLALKSTWKIKFNINDTSKAANVIFAREWRNYVHHTKAEDISLHVFNTQWSKGVAIITNLGLCTYDHASLKTTSLDPAQQLVSSGIMHYISIVKEDFENEKKVDKNQYESMKVQLKIHQERLQSLEEQFSRSIFRKRITSEEGTTNIWR